MVSSCANATEMFRAMIEDVEKYGFSRLSTDSEGPCKVMTKEAAIGSAYELRFLHHNVVGDKSISLKWAVASVLHFFTGSDEAACLRMYNRDANKFLTGDLWVGAYGTVAMPQIERCILRLRENPYTRRTTVCLGGLEAVEDANRPACITSLHFILGRNGLTTVAYQRSCNLLTLMPYDCILLANIANYVAVRSSLPVGPLVWSFGSLHVFGEAKLRNGERHTGVIVDPSTLADPKLCSNILEGPKGWKGDKVLGVLSREGEVRT